MSILPSRWSITHLVGRQVVGDTKHRPLPSGGNTMAPITYSPDAAPESFVRFVSWLQFGYRLPMRRFFREGTRLYFSPLLYSSIHVFPRRLSTWPGPTALHQCPISVTCRTRLYAALASGEAPPLLVPGVIGSTHTDRPR